MTIQNLVNILKTMTSEKRRQNEFVYERKYNNLLWDTVIVEVNELDYENIA